MFSRTLNAMSETPTLNRPKAIKSGSGPKLLRVAALKPPEKPEDKNGEIAYCIHYVMMDGKAILNHACTKNIYTWLRNERPWMRVRSNWVLAIDRQTNVVTHVTETPKPDLLPSFKKTPEEGKEAPSKLVKIALFPDGSSAAIHIPERVSEDIVAEIQQEIANAEEELHPGTGLGRFVLAKREEEQGQTIFHVDPMPR